MQFIHSKRAKIAIRTAMLLAVLIAIGGLITQAAPATHVLASTITQTSPTSRTFTQPYATPVPPGGGQLGLSVTSGMPGSYLFLAGNGYTPGEMVQPIWGYKGTGTGVAMKSFYLFNPIVKADSTGSILDGFFVPDTAGGTYTIAAHGLTSNVIDTASFQVTGYLDTGLYQGAPGSTLRIATWGLGAKEAALVYWNWSSTNPGTLIAKISTDSKGHAQGRTYTIPAGTAPGTYTVAAVGQTSGTIATALVVVGNLSITPNPTSPNDWTFFGYNNQQTRNNPAETTISPTNVGTLAVKWKLASFPFYKIEASPTVVNGIAYVGTVQGTVMAINATTGSLLWIFAANGPIYGSPLIQGGIAYFGTVNYPNEETVGNYAYALNAQTGSLIWDNPLTNGGVWVTPLVSNGTVFFTAANKEGASGGLDAFNAITGAPVWTDNTAFGIWAPDSIDPTGNHLYVGTGNPCFTTTPQPGDGCSGGVEDVNPATGAVNWLTHFPDNSGDDDVAAAAMNINGKIYVASKNGIFYCLDATTGNILWQYNTGSSGDFGIYSSGAYNNGAILFGGGDRLVHAVDANTGALLWTYAAGSLVTSSPSVANGVAYVGVLNGNFLALNPSTGALLWKYTISGSVWGSAAISNGVVYETGGDGNIYAFSPNGQ